METTNTFIQLQNAVIRCNEYVSIGFYNYLMDKLIYVLYQNKSNFSKKVNINRVLISGFIHGRLQPDIYQQRVISEALGIPKEVLFDKELMRKIKFESAFDLMQEKKNET